MGADVALGSSPGSYITMNLSSKQTTDLSSLLTTSTSSDCLSPQDKNHSVPFCLPYFTLHLLAVIESNCLVPQGTR